ncbi:zinc finger MYM-type protein 4 [Trichonephila clavata]|uniref:Zinc finger MYM-type protein 4 n=1 Tax=Trichonephila clavata TaxID=2740835 RepID=A0A8X6LXG6_TRICU|nr:zinc finger MYM-type protein 4 [Trichonephila clavata]
MPKTKKQSAATLAKKARARKNKEPLQNSAEKALSASEPSVQTMAELSPDVEDMVINDLDENAVNNNKHEEKENGFCNDDVKNDILVKKPNKVISNAKSNNDVIQSNSNHNNLSEDEDAVNSDSSNKGKNEGAQSKHKSQKNDVDKKDSLSDELNKANIQASENSKDLNSLVSDEELESKTSSKADCPSATDSEKQSCVEENSIKLNSIPDRLFDDSPKCSPETITADFDPVIGKIKPSDSNASKPEIDAVEGIDSSKVNETATNTNADVEEKETESKTTSGSKSGGKKEGGKKKKNKHCAQCELKKKLHFRIVFQGKAYQLCSEACYKNFKAKQTVSKPAAPAPPESVDVKCGQCQKPIKSGQGYYPVVGDTKSLCSEECLRKYHDYNGPIRNCSQCKKRIESVYSQLTWETMIFCNEECLGKYQSFLGSHCTCCQGPVQQSSLGKYCVCFGADIRQFCSGNCLEEYKRGLKVCTFCQTDLSVGTDGFLAPVGDKGQFKDFCSQQCMERYEGLNNLSKTVPNVQECAHCKRRGSFKIQVKYEDKMHSLCCDMCVAGFRRAFKITEKVCDSCYKFFNLGSDNNFSLKYEGSPRYFCRKACMTLFVLSHRKIVQCVQCKVKKYTFDMIERISDSNQIQMYCSLNCLSLFRVNVNATSSKCIRCDNCTKNIPAQYHLTMSDGSIRNFCTYQCVLCFQNQFPTASPLSTSSAVRQPAPKPAPKTPAPPVITNVASIAQTKPAATAQGKNLAPQTLVSVRQQGPSIAVLSSKTQVSTIPSTALTVSAPPPGTPTVIREIVVRPPTPKSVKNKSAAVKPIMLTKGINVKLVTCHKAVQTDERPMPIILPVPIPVYVPTPMHMFSRPVPCPVPFPIPIPVPVIIHSNKGHKEESIPNHDTDSVKTTEFTNDSNEKQKGSNKTLPTQQTEKMEGSQKDATGKKLVDLMNTQSIINAELRLEPEDDNVSKEKSKHRNKREGDLKQKEAKKAKLDVNNLDASDDGEANKQIAELMNLNCEDTDSKLKYAFGVNAWRQWINERNLQIDKVNYSARKLKAFKADILQLSSEDLNYNLSLFVKEITRPSGEKYTAGALFYLVLGLQLYLHENGRIDNIFADEAFNQFTDNFHDILVDYESRALVQEVPWSRIEEEFLWDSRQLGAHSPQVLLNTLIYFNTKYFKMKGTSDHMGLCFPHISRRVSRKMSRNGTFRSYLYYHGALKNAYEDDDEDEDIDLNDSSGIVQPENENNHLRCPVRLYEFYISKCPPSVFDKNSRFYLSPDKSCVPDNPIWYTSTPLSREVINKTLQRIKLIEELYDE